jgi:hypothetical protein
MPSPQGPRQSMASTHRRSTNALSPLPEDTTAPEASLLGEENISRKTSISGNHEGRFTTKRSSTARLQSVSPVKKLTFTNSARGGSLLGQDNLRKQISTMHRRISTVEYEPNLEHTKDNTSSYDINKEETFWDATDTHHMLPVFASARAYVPSSFMSLLVQSFFSVLTPLICEKLVCGQTGQSVIQIALPKKLVGRSFLDLYRVFCFHHVSSPTLWSLPFDLLSFSVSLSSSGHLLRLVSVSTKTFECSASLYLHHPTGECSFSFSDSISLLHSLIPPSLPWTGSSCMGKPPESLAPSRPATSFVVSSPFFSLPPLADPLSLT